MPKPSRSVYKVDGSAVPYLQHTNARIIINQEEGSWAVASLILEFGQTFEHKICLGWVSDVTSEASSFIGLRNEEEGIETWTRGLHPSIIKEARDLVTDEEKPPALTRFERITRED